MSIMPTGKPIDLGDFTLGGTPTAMEPGPQLSPIAMAMRKHSTGSRIAGILSEFVAGLGGGSSGYTQGLLREKQQDREDQRSLLQRQLQMADQRSLYDYKLAHPEPRAPTNTQSTYEYIKSIRPELADSYLTNMATAPPLVVPNSDGTRTVYPQGSIPRTAAPAQPQILQQLPPGVKPYTPGGAPSTGARTFR